MENGFLKKIGLVATAAGTLGSAEAAPLPPAEPGFREERSASPRMLWAGELERKIDSLGDAHELRDIESVRALERECLTEIKKHLVEGKGTYTTLDYATLLGHYRRINDRFSLWEGRFEEKYAAEGEYGPTGELDRLMMLNELEHLASAPRESDRKTTVAYPGTRPHDDGGSE